MVDWSKVRIDRLTGYTDFVPEDDPVRKAWIEYVDKELRSRLEAQREARAYLGIFG